MARFQLGACILGAALIAAVSMASRAATLQISPVTIELRPQQTAAALTLSNSGNEPIYGQVRVFRWDQVNGGDTLTPSQEVVASPPLIQIAARGEQMIRLIKTASIPSTTESSYRILIDEIPQPEALSGNGVLIRMRYSVPVFVQSAGKPGQPDLNWELSRKGQEWLLEATNSGTRHARISGVQLVGASGQVHEINKGLLGYALAGKGRQWQISLPPGVEPGKNARGTKARIRAAINGKPAEGAVRVASD